jgi:KUP system potassium uptake protein
LQSTVDAEYYSLVAEMQEGLWLISLIKEIGFELPLPIRLMEDNQGCIAVAQNPGNHSRTKHIDIRNHFIREKIAEKTFILEYCPTDKMIADIFTKALPRIQFERLRDMM